VFDAEMEAEMFMNKLKYYVAQSTNRSDSYGRYLVQILARDFVVALCVSMQILE
jgi:hypothetical protein